MLDSENVENRKENRPLQSQKRRPSTSKPLQLQPSKMNPSAGERRNKENDSESTPTGFQDQEMAQAMMRQHRRRLMAGGQVAASTLTPHHAALVVEEPALNGCVSKGTRWGVKIDAAT